MIATQKPIVFKTTVRGCGPYCVEFFKQNGSTEIIQTRSKKRALSIAKSEELEAIAKEILETLTMKPAQHIGKYTKRAWIARLEAVLKVGKEG